MEPHLADSTMWLRAPRVGRFPQKRHWAHEQGGQAAPVVKFGARLSTVSGDQLPRLDFLLKVMEIKAVF